MRQKHLTLAFTAIALSLCSCSKSIDEVIEPTEKRAVEIFTRSSSAASIEYPLTLYAFSSDGTLKESTTANNAEASLQMQLPVGDSYRLVALAGATGLTPVTTPTANTDIGIPTSGLITSPIQMGQAVINTITTDVEANITLSYQVAQLTIQLRNIPTDATAANVTLSSLYSGLTYNGVPSGNKTVTVELSKSGSDATTWAASTVYTLPGVERIPLVVGINIVTNNKTQNYSYTHTSTLQAGTPYSLIGTYDGDFNLTSTITPTGWNAAEEISFTFGAESPNNGGGNGDTYTVETLPAVRTIWDGHFVAEVNVKENNTAELLLLSLNEWETTGANAAQCISSYEVINYSENGISKWSIPTSSDFLRIIPTLSMDGNIDATQAAFRSVEGGKALTNGGQYLCDNGAKFVKMGDKKTNNAITADETAYRLRLVKTVTVSVQ